MTAPAAPFVPVEARGAPVLAIYVVYAGSLDAGEEVLRPLRELGPPLLDLVQSMPYSAVQTMADILWPPGSHKHNGDGAMNRVGDGETAFGQHLRAGLLTSGTRAFRPQPASASVGASGRNPVRVEQLVLMPRAGASPSLPL